MHYLLKTFKELSQHIIISISAT